MLSRRRFVAAGLAAASPGLLGAAPRSASSGGLDGIVDRGARLAEVYAGARWCEGPVWDRRSASLVFSDVRRNRILRLTSGGEASLLRDPSNYANGNTFDRRGRLISCEHLGRRVVRQEADGRITVLADRYRGRRLNSPNDVVVARDGSTWFTDPTYGLEQPEEGRQGASEQLGRFVFRLDPDGTLAIASDTFEQPNGIAFSPDQRTLYVSDTSSPADLEGKREIRAFDVQGRKLTNERLFGAVPSGIPDGLEVDEQGRVYAATDRGATIWTQAGVLLGHIPTPVTCSNLAFGGRDGRRLFLCTGTSLHAIDLKTRGAA